MAQPPDTSEIFLREVDENMRRDRARDFAKRYGNVVIGAVILFLAASGALIYWQYHQRQKSEAQVEQLSKSFADVGANKTAQVPAQLQAIAADSSDGVRAAALFGQAAVLLQNGDRKGAVAIYTQLSGDSGLPQPFRDAATIRQTAIQFDDLKPDQVIARMEPLAKPGEPWFGSAGEMTALALIKQGKTKEAAALALAIAKDKTAPPSLRARIAQLAGSLGADTSGIQESLIQ